jgi:lipopolysaccharide/colanic/teichoic acid biosynthesis glycosyltransferase
MAKRALDLLLGAIALVVCTPALLLAMTLIRMVDGSPVLFRQIRPGYKGRPFTLYKLRTMKVPRGEAIVPATDATRLTSLGRVLRQLSIDELPQFWNVIRGDISLVGPRPLLMQYLDRYTPEQARRHEVKPGITGWAQVNGRNAISWKDRFEFDMWYVDHHNLCLDIRILGRTLIQIFRRRDISQPGHATMPEFIGSGESRAENDYHD